MLHQPERNSPVRIVRILGARYGAGLEDDSDELIPYTFVGVREPSAENRLGELLQRGHP